MQMIINDSFCCSYESGILEDPQQEAPESLYQMTKDPTKIELKPDRLEVEFKRGIPVRVKHLDEGVEKTDSLELYLYLNEIG